MKQKTQKILHFRFLNQQPKELISMWDYRLLRQQVNEANELLSMNSANPLQFPTPELSAYGGYTVVIVTDNDTNQTNIGIAKCNDGFKVTDEYGTVTLNRGDRFVRKEGVAKALENLESNKELGVSSLVLFTDIQDRRLFEYLRDVELLDDSLVDMYNEVHQGYRDLRLQKREKSFEYTRRQYLHKKHLAEQAVRSEEWHKLNG